MSTPLENSPILTTQLTAYRYNLTNETERAAYVRLHAELSETRKCFATITSNSGLPKIVSGAIQLETRHVFENQWNCADNSETNPKMRVFDWAESIQPNTNIKLGHFLTLSYEMIEIRKDVSKCGYCGSMHWLNHGLAFCNQCLDSEYLEEKQLKLLRLRPISESKDDFPPLSANEKDPLRLAFIEAQTVAVGSRAAAANKKTREELDEEYTKAVNEAETKHDGFTWLMDNNVNITNCIYYSHLNTFCFGWKQPVSESVRDAILEIISGFSFPYQIKCNDGKTLERQ